MDDITRDQLFKVSCRETSVDSRPWTHSDWQFQSGENGSNLRVSTEYGP